MIVDLVSEVPPLGMSPQLLVGEPQRPVDLVCVCVDPDALRRRCPPMLRTSPRARSTSERAPTPLRSAASRPLMRVGDRPRQFGCLRQDRVCRKHEAREHSRDVRRWGRACIAIGVQEVLIPHASHLAAPEPSPAEDTVVVPDAPPRPCSRDLEDDRRRAGWSDKWRLGVSVRAYQRLEAGERPDPFTWGRRGQRPMP